jgi:MoaA/NifB/PqqE/SkfB family radical SAM enzyme
MISGIDACLDEGAIHFNIIGGEPTLYDKLFDVISYIHTRKALVSLATNGFLLDKNYVGMLKRYKVDVILISLDYLDAEAHDSFTKLKGSFSRVIEAIDNCISVGLTVFVSTVLTNERLHNNEFKKILEFCGKKKIICHINLPTLFGRWKKRKDLLFSAEDIEIIKSFYRFPYLQSCETNAYFFPGCSPGLEKLHITSYGDVLPCAFIPINFGNILLEPLGLIRQRMHGFSFFNAYNEMCVPSTNKKYYEIFDKLLSETEKLPINFKVFDKVYRQSLL